MENEEELLDNVRIENERYLRRHPELGAMVKDFMIALLKDKPEDVFQYASVFFTSSYIDSSR